MQFTECDDLTMEVVVGRAPLGMPAAINETRKSLRPRRFIEGQPDGIKEVSNMRVLKNLA